MSFFRPRTLPGFNWPPLVDGSIAQLWVAYLHLDRTQWLAPAEIEAGQLEQLRTLLAHAVMNVPYYREVLPAAKIVPGAIRTMSDFRRLPLLPRRVFQEKLASFEAQRLPPGTVATASANTSGSTGAPTTVLQTNLVHLCWYACLFRDMEWCNIRLPGTLAAIRSSGKKSKTASQVEGITRPSWLPDLDRLIETGPLHLMGIQQEQRAQLRWLRTVRPDYLLSYPTNLEALANLVREEGPLPGLKAIQAISETLTPEAQADIESAFGVPVHNTYSCVEVGYLASPCRNGHGLHVHAENVLLEVLDERGEPCRPGETGRVFVTALQNFRSPLIRYELGDQATVGAERCPCGRGLPLLARVQGKSYPMFHLADGRRKSSVTAAFQVRKAGGHWQSQIVQKAIDHVVVRLATTSDWNAQRAADLTERLQTFFEAPIRVDIEAVDYLPVPASGKFRSLVNELE